MLSTIAGLTAAAAVLAAGPAAPRDHQGYGETKLTLSYLADAGFARAVKLECDPAGGGHPQPDQACAELARVNGDAGRIEPGHSACFLIYAPVTAEITGTWHGATVTWSHKFGNICEMRRATGDLFTF
ncbi:SSI family serine proteinase inhibitor [Actinoplanes sp. NPDC026619]|uniref:SSI family serine proteinase inhibitor n=1 Tax=Actinoplanes sp. NPDC026619 TaxID=3155798 RepID=UPI0033CF1490